MPFSARVRLLAPFALAVLAQVVAESPAEAADNTPAPRLDPSVQRPWFMAMRGASTTEAWIVMQSNGSKANDQAVEAVVDLKTGCVVETMPPFKHLTKLNATRPDPFAKGTRADESNKVEALLSTDAGVKADIVRYVAAGRRFGQRRLAFGSIGSDGIAFSSDGKTIAIEGSEAVFRSRDGGSTYDRLDTNMNRTPAVTTDGKWILFERCADASKRNQVCPDSSREVRIVAADNSTAGRTVAIGSGLLRGLDPTGQKLVIVRYDLGAEVTVMHIDPSTASAAPARVFAIGSTVVQKNRFHDIEPSPKTGTFGLFDDNDVFPTNVMTVFSMTDGKVSQKLTVSKQMSTHVDDEAGRLLWQTYPDDHSWARKPGGSAIDLGIGDPLGWAPGGRALVFQAKYANGARAPEPAATLSSVACKMVKVIPVL